MKAIPGILVALGSMAVACGSAKPPPNSQTPIASAVPLVVASVGPTASPPAAASAAGEPKHQLVINLDSHFAVRERTATSTIILEIGKERLLEIHKFEGQGCSDELIPRIGEITANTRTETEKRGDLEFRWFTQRSSIEHAPFTSVGFYLCSNRSFLLIRYVGPENAIKDAKDALQALMANRSIVVE